MKHNFQVNWINGMKITSDHFIDLENHFVSRSSSMSRAYICELNYGLIPLGEGETNLPEFLISFNQSKIKVIRGFTAITPDGNLIQIPSGTEYPITKPEADFPWFYLVVSVIPMNRIPYGVVDENETPMRYPFTLPEYQFHFLPPNETLKHKLGNNSLPVGKYRGGSFEEEGNFLPPCTSIQSNPFLIVLCAETQKSFYNLENKIFDLLKKPYIKEKAMLTNLVDFFNQYKTAIDWFLPYQPPVFLAEKVKQISRIIFYSNESMYKNSSGMLSEIIDYQYCHIELGKMAEMIEKFNANYSRLLPDAFIGA